QSEAHTADFTPYAAAPVPSWNFGKTPLLASLAPRNFTPPGGRVLQRVCACNHTMAGGECDECREKRDYSIFTGFWYGSRGAFIVECWPPHMITEDKAMFGPGAYRPDPTEGMTR